MHPFLNPHWCTSPGETRSVMHNYFRKFEPHLVRQHKANHLHCCCFWAVGVNDIWAVDQHDKWLQFGLALHTGIEPFSGQILWLKVWHLNHNPQLVLSYYLETIENLGCKYIYYSLYHAQTDIQFDSHSYDYSEWPQHQEFWNCECTDNVVSHEWLIA